MAKRASKISHIDATADGFYLSHGLHHIHACEDPIMSGTYRASILAALAAAALALLLTVAAPASAAAPKKPKGQPRITVSQITDPPATAVQVGDTVEMRVTVRNRGRKAARSGVKLIVPESKGAFKGRQLALEPRQRFPARSKRRFDLSFVVPESLTPTGDSPDASYELAACVRHFGKGSDFRCKTAKRPLTVEIPPLPPNFKPGARTAGDTLFPQIGNTGYDAGHYALDLDYDPATNRFQQGTKATMTATSTQDLGQFSLDFQRLTVSKVTVDGADAPLPARRREAEARRRDAAGQAGRHTARGHPRGRRVHGRRPLPRRALRDHRSGRLQRGLGPRLRRPADAAHLRRRLVVNEPIGAAGWFPNNNVPTDKATYRTAITAPNTHTALGIGELSSKQILPGGEDEVDLERGRARWPAT